MIQAVVDRLGWRVLGSGHLEVPTLAFPGVVFGLGPAAFDMLDAVLLGDIPRLLTQRGPLLLLGRTYYSADLSPYLAARLELGL